MKKYLSAICCIISISLNGNIPPGGFKPFSGTYFVETGTYNGNGIQEALRAGFTHIHSIELNLNRVLKAQKKFRNNKNIKIWHGDSGSILYQVIKDINEPIVFWLDGHAGVYNPTQENTPILRELDQIKYHHIKNHTILIDDMHCTGKPLFDFITKEMIIEKIKEINPLYKITYIDGGDRAEYPDNIMVAYIPA